MNNENTSEEIFSAVAKGAGIRIGSAVVDAIVTEGVSVTTGGLGMLAGTAVLTGGASLVAVVVGYKFYRYLKK